MRALALVTLAGLASPALAQAAAPQPFLGDILEPVHGRSVCYARVYDAEHLRRNPGQKVRSLVLQVRHYHHKPSKFSPDGQRNYYFALAARVKGERGRLVATGECGAGGDLSGCGPECDGGGFTLTRGPGGTLLLDLSDYKRLRMSRGCGGGDDEEDAFVLEPGPDDLRFRLSPADPAQCRGLPGD